MKTAELRQKAVSGIAGEDDTIAAPLTAPGHAAVSVVRVSGALSGPILKKLTADAERVLSAARQLFLVRLNDPLGGMPLLDHALAVFFPAPRSFTGEDCLELQLHGSPFIVARLLENLMSLGARVAEPGEFTRRAFLNGRIDLTQAEAVADLVAAETEGQARVAQMQLSGALADAVDRLGEPLRDALADMEAQIDFPDEDIPEATIDDWRKKLQRVQLECERYLGSYRTGRLHRDGAHVVLLGLPNAGKSSLLNRLTGEDRAIVTPVAGTTRDSIEQRISLGGFLIHLWDTAGVRDAESVADEVERFGVARSWKHATEADLVILVVDASSDSSSARNLLTELQTRKLSCLVVANKNDLPRDPGSQWLSDFSATSVSAVTGEGIGLLRNEIVRELRAAEMPSSAIFITTERHKTALEGAQKRLSEAHAAIDAALPLELVALSIREALTALEEIVGVTATEDILGRIFSKFCIGK